MTILCLPRPRACDSRFLKTCPAARPSLSAVSAVTGSMFAVPRTPSVPKIFLGMFMMRVGMMLPGAGDAFNAHVGGGDGQHDKFFGHADLDGFAKLFLVLRVGH